VDTEVKNDVAHANETLPRGVASIHCSLAKFDSRNQLMARQTYTGDQAKAKIPDLR